MTLCASIRSHGKSQGLWGAHDFIVAVPETIAFTSREILGNTVAVHLTLHSGFDGMNVHEVKTLGVPPCAVFSIHMYNPVGVHFDPLWPI